MAPGRVAVERVPRLGERRVLGELYRELVDGDGHLAAVAAVNDRDGAAPVALARDAPVAQAIVDLALGDGLAGERRLLEAVRNGIEGRLDVETVHELRVDHHAVIDVGRAGLDLGDRAGARLGVRRRDDGDDRQAVSAGELDVALVMRRAAEDGARAVVHQNEVRDVDRQLPVRVERVRGDDARIDALLLRAFDRRERGAHAAALLAEGGDSGIGLRRRQSQRVIRRDGQEGSAIERVRARREDLELGRAVRCGAIQRPADQQALGSSDPVLLHNPDLLGPLVERAERLDEVIGELGDLESPLQALALLDERA